MRLFVALRVPDAARKHLEEFLEPRLDAFPVRWTPPEHWHLTLAFVADAPERTLDALSENLRSAVGRHRALPTRLAGAGAFPDPFAARVLWLAPELDDGERHELLRLATACRTAAATAGIAVDGARFVPHLTLARTPRPTPAHRWLQVMETYSGPAWTATEVELVASHLGEARRNARRHEVLERFPLGPSAG
ncbi:MAG TPA: RNA 2',3'-cyclic phosphodiesterase [Micrococcales bacterium]|uniref:RNA 2',3'-cyclic phosphodiesterase n=1 Tax=Miniimonas arenae TaxID=676201 RepID=A0A5C5BC50_9MICO|nr:MULTISPECIES: RNA 2',3'-cyclic phosphodiesterase [Miniimonas]TNU75117.1 RNA 2',3'-cyclic phosphodiesterase [Miniimonas arenae]HCX84216.1 RNA 2',3'-cyclic phosphodiesterase [Micrococcales bacterium]